LYELQEDNDERWEVIEDIIILRASFLIDRVLTGLRLDFDRALDLLKNHNVLTSEKEWQERDMLMAAIDNLVDFAAHEEIKMMDELPDERIFNGIDVYESTFEKYNLRYASEENQDVLHAATIAAWWLTVHEESILTFMTQADERVRAWHLSMEGLSFLKRDFPPELIPPIEWGCRCFLISNGFDSIVGSLGKTGYKKHINPVFCESLAKGGKIFSLAHPYFKTPLPKQAKAIVSRIKQKFNIL
jgi:hypothetical protein